MQRTQLLGRDQRVHFLLRLLPDFPDLLLFLPRRERRIFAHPFDLRMSVALNGVAPFYHRLADAGLLPAGLLAGSRRVRRLRRRGRIARRGRSAILR